MPLQRWCWSLTDHRGPGSLSLSVSLLQPGLLDSHLAVFSPPPSLLLLLCFYIYRIGCADDRPSRAGLTVDPVGQGGDGTASSLSLLPLWCFCQTPSRGFFFYPGWKTDITERLLFCVCGAQRDGPKRDRKKDGDEEMRRDTGVGGGGWSPLSAVLFAVFCRVYDPLSPPPFVFLYLSLPWCVPFASVLRAAPGVTPFPLVRKNMIPPASSSYCYFYFWTSCFFFFYIIFPFYLSIRRAAWRRGGGDVSAWGQVKEKRRHWKEEPREKRAPPPLCCLSAGRGGRPSCRLEGDIKEEIWGGEEEEEGSWWSSAEVKTEKKGAFSLMTDPSTPRDTLKKRRIP